ncbi:T4-like phage baseplate hub + tail lysozyme [Caballeronia glathei]|uniref:Lysozyme n=1 Tax=Caballeronia glathei TaxID=60547 RepID=A0A069PEV8_9BURK|nr:glycoside hydrolase family protein [Caballeronia glathei]KDR39173.1 lysozyme [Caballeronia glathei]CDY76096.1 T4-like phage baseplate hub + tail lysozyme [Caballeronia glathei]
MTDDNLRLLIAELRRDEGVEYKPYKDTKGILTVGVGHNLQAIPLPAGWSYPLTDEQVDVLLTDDIRNVFEDLDRNLPWWVDLNDVRQRVLANMGFNLGITKLLGFRNTLGAMRQGKYDDAARGMLNSAWASQVKGRAIRLADMMRKGQ